MLHKAILYLIEGYLILLIILGILELCLWDGEEVFENGEDVVFGEFEFVI